MPRPSPSRLWIMFMGVALGASGACARGSSTGVDNGSMDEEEEEVFGDDGPVDPTGGSSGDPDDGDQGSAAGGDQGSGGAGAAAGPTSGPSGSTGPTGSTGAGAGSTGQCDGVGNCDACIDCALQNDCVVEADACFTSQACIDVDDCVYMCTDAQCYDGCMQMAGADLWLNAASCIFCYACTGSCPEDAASCM